MDATEILYTSPANAMKNALSTEMSLTPTLQIHQQQQQQQQQQLSPLATTMMTATTPTTPRTATHTPREIPSMYILDQMYDDYMDQYNSNNITAPTEVPETNASAELAPCPICSRTFNPATLRKHVGICEKMAMKKRNIFDSSRQRREGTDLATYPLPKNFGLPEKTTSSTSITQGRNDRGQSPKPAIQQVSSPIMTRKKPSEDLTRSTARTSMRKAVATNSNTSLVATSIPSSNFNRDRMRSSERSLTRRGIQLPPAEQCPHCERCFGIKAYDRHVEWCKEKALLASIKHGNSKNDGNLAKARLEARTKYRAPCLKTKRSINREKYSGLAGEEPEIEDTSKCSKTSLNKTQDNSSMSMSMTSSMCSERKITNSATGNINEPVATKVQKSNCSVGNRKCLRDKTQTLQPPTTAYTAPAAEKEVQNEEPIINLEIQMPEFHLMGEQMTPTSINKRRRATKATKTKVDTATAAKIKPLKQKQEEQEQTTEHEHGLRMDSKISYQKWKASDVQIKLPSPVLERKKSTSDLSLNSMCCDKFHNALEIDNDHNYYYDNFVSAFDEVNCKANEAPVENLNLSESSKFVGSLKKSSKENNLKQGDLNFKMTIEDNLDKEDIYGLENDDCSTKLPNYQCKENEAKPFENVFYDSRIMLDSKKLLIDTTKNLHSVSKSRDLGPSKDLAQEVIEVQNEGLIMKQLNPRQLEDFEINKSRKSSFSDVEENISLLTKTTSPNTTTSIQEYSKTQESRSGTRMCKDCLTDSDELARQKVIIKQKLINQQINKGAAERECKCAKSLRNEQKTIKNASYENSNKHKELKDNYEKCTHTLQSITCSKSSVDLNCLKRNLRNSSPTKINKPPPCISINTPRRSRPSSPPPQSSSTTEIITKNENSRLKSLKMCQPKRKKVLRQTASCTNACPMKALMLPLSMENLKICGVSSAPQIKSNSERDNAMALPPGKGKEIEYKEEMCNDIEVNEGEKNTCVLDKEIKVIKEPPQLKRNRSFTVIGLPDNYDPFLSAKRQLEELCSPSADSVDIPPTTPQTPQLPSMPATPNSNSKMSTSLILSSSTPNTTPSLMTTSHMPQHTQKTPTLARSSSFRRTSSLRGPRRSPMLTTRPPLFAQKHRPTIQRGLSDEGPISTNFLKPEEYDEMPVRSVCVNDFAANKSPRVVRRDTSASNRKQPLKLNINAANANSSSSTVSPSVKESDVVNHNSGSKYVSKTDSLAVFLKFEHELEKLNSVVTDGEHKTENLLDVTTLSADSTIATPQSNLDGPLNAKELKDKSNNLSKQNSAKNIKADILAANDGTENCDKTLNTTAQISTNDLEAVKYGRLAPLAAKTSTPLLKPSTPQQQQQTTTQLQLTPLNVKNSLALNQEQKVHKSLKPVALSSIFGSDNKNTKQTPTQYSERKNSIGSDYIDPKLINKCDNLSINLNLKRTEFKLSDFDTSEPRLEHFSSSSSESSVPGKKTTSQAQHAKFLPTVNQEQQPQQQQPHEQNNNLNQKHFAVTNSQRNSAEGRNLLKRRMRLGRNQFLYDASPEGDSCSADDEGANRSSMEGDASQQHYNSIKERERALERLSSVQGNPIDTPFIPPLPAFDDFDFEEFLSSFENDEEQFPLFRDCREFLMNRTSKKQRSMLVPSSATQYTNNTSSYSNCANLKKSPSPQTFPPLTPQSHPIAGQHFQFPTLSQNPKHLFNSFSLSTRARNKYDELAATKSTDTFCVNSHTEEYKDLDKKREIFISIETEQNDSDKSPISPNSIRNMVGNPQTVVEVEVDAAHDNKFSKISDDDDADASQNNCRSKNFSGHLAAKHLPNVQLNNAKNLMQKIHEDFRQVNDEMCDNLRLTMENRTAAVDVNMNTSSTIPGNERNKISGNRGADAPNADAYGDSDDLSSLDGYPLSSPNSRLGVSSKTSADSAYGSLSRQRSSELTSQRSSGRNRSMNSNTTNTLFNRPVTEETSLSRSRQLSASSSSSSEHGLPPITNSSSFHKLHKQQQQQQHQQQHLYNNNNNIANDLDDLMRFEHNNNNNSDIQSGYVNLTGATNSHSNLESLQQYTSNSTMSTSMKMSKFCHECGSKFPLEQAKFCMDCGVKRIVL